MTYEVKQRLGCCCPLTLAQADALNEEIENRCQEIPQELQLPFKHGIIGTSAELISMGPNVYEDTSPRESESPSASRPTTVPRLVGRQKAREDNGTGVFKSSKLSVDDARDLDQEEIEMQRTIASTQTAIRILGCELAFMVQTLKINIYAPLCPRPQTQPPPPLTPAFQKVLSCANATIRIGKIVHDLINPTPHNRPSTSVRSPLLSICSLERFLIDATFVSCQICFGHTPAGPNEKTGMDAQHPDVNEVMASINMGLKVLELTYPPRNGPTAPSTSSQPPSADGPSTLSKAVVALRRRYIEKMASLRLPHSGVKRSRTTMEETQSNRDPQPTTVAPVTPAVEHRPPEVIQLEERASTQIDRENEPDQESEVQSVPSAVQMPPPPIPHRRKSSARPSRSSIGTEQEFEGTLKEKGARKKKASSDGMSVSSKSSASAEHGPKFSLRTRRPEVKKEAKKEAKKDHGPLFTNTPRIVKNGQMVNAEQKAEQQVCASACSVGSH